MTSSDVTRDDVNSGRDPAQTVSPRGVAAACIIATIMVALFWTLSSGDSLRVTFVPCAVLALGLIVTIFRTRWPLPTAGRFLPVFVVAMVWQLLHFAEEFQTGFWREFPALYGGAPYSPATFVWFNMTAYAVFLLAALGVFHLRRDVFLMPVVFFVVYGALGNANAHIVFALLIGGYFPGLVTAVGYVVIGPLVLHRLLPRARWWQIAAVVAVIVAVQTPLLLLA